MAIDFSRNFVQAKTGNRFHCGFSLIIPAPSLPAQQPKIDICCTVRLPDAELEISLGGGTVTWPPSGDIPGALSHIRQRLVDVGLPGWLFDIPAQDLTRFHGWLDQYADHPDVRAARQDYDDALISLAAADSSTAYATALPTAAAMGRHLKKAVHAAVVEARERAEQEKH